MKYKLYDTTNGGALDGMVFDTEEDARRALIRFLTQEGCGTRWEGSDDLDGLDCLQLYKLSGVRLEYTEA